MVSVSVDRYLSLYATSINLGRLCDCKMIQPFNPQTVVTGNTGAQTLVSEDFADSADSARVGNAPSRREEQLHCDVPNSAIFFQSMSVLDSTRDLTRLGPILELHKGAELL